MKLTRFRPIFPELTEEFGFPEVPPRFARAFENLFPRLPGELKEFAFIPDIDIVDADAEMLLTAELPGLKNEDVQIDVSDGVLTLKGEKKQEMEKKEARYRIFERNYGAFERSFTLPRTVEAEKIMAEMEDGVLKVHLPKTPKALGRRVEIGGK